MNLATIHFHLTLAWVWIMAGVISGTLMGLNFHREDWLGGYASHKRRFYRLAHISFFGLGLLNLAFYLTVQHLKLEGTAVSLASIGFILGAITMPIVCVLTAHAVGWRHLFAIPVGSLLAATGCTLLEVL